MKEEGATSVMRERKERGINNESRGHGEGQTERKEGRGRSGGCLEASLQDKGCKLEVGAGLYMSSAHIISPSAVYCNMKINQALYTLASCLTMR